MDIVEDVCKDDGIWNLNIILFEGAGYMAFVYLRSYMFALYM
jgi:hypothetical protein